MGIPVGGYYQSSPQISFDWIGQAWSLFKAQAGTWMGAILLYLLAAALIGVPIAYATGYAHDVVTQVLTVLNSSRPGAPMLPQSTPFANVGHSLLFSFLFNLFNWVFVGGLYRMALRQARGEAISVAGAFSAIDVALPLIGAGLISLILTMIGYVLCILPMFLVLGLVMFAPLLVVDRRLGPFQAVQESFLLLKSQWLMVTLFYFVIALISGLGAILFGIGIVVTYPLLFLSVAVGYLAFTQPQRPMPEGYYGAAQPGVWPPPPGQAPPPPTAPPGL